LLIAAIGCGHKTLTITTSSLAPPAGGGGAAPGWNDGNTKMELDGVPFYLKVGACKKLSVWLEPQYTLTLTLAVDKRPPITHTLTLTRSAYTSDPDVKNLLKTLAGISGKHPINRADPFGCPAKLRDQWEDPKVLANIVPLEEIEDRPGIAQAAAAHNIILVSNAATVTTAVDYSHVYYMNAKTPWIGTAQVDAKLADDGTLTEGSGQVDDETWSTILSTISSLAGDFTGASAAAAAAPAAAPAAAGGADMALDLSQEELAKFKQDCPDSPDWPKPEHSVTYTFKPTTTVYQHDFTKLSFDLSNQCVPEPKGLQDGNYTITKVNPDAGDDSKKDKTITVSGTVVLPDAKDPKAKAK
jgi:hypothetical protein